MAVNVLRKPRNWKQAKVFLTLCFTSSDERKEILTRKSERTLQTLRQTNGYEHNWKCHQGRKGSDRFSSCYSVTERVDDETKRPRRPAVERPKKSWDLQEEAVETHLYEVHDEDNGDDDDDNDDDDDENLIISLHKVLEQKSRVLSLHIFPSTQCTGTIFFIAVCTDIFLGNLIYFLCRKNMKPKNNFLQKTEI